MTEDTHGTQDADHRRRRNRRGRETSSRADEQERDRIRLDAHFDALSFTAESLLREHPELNIAGKESPVRQLHEELFKELRRTAIELRRFGDDHRGLETWRPCAGARETLEEATRRILVEGGAKPYQIAKAAQPDKPSAELGDTKECQAAKTHRREFRALLERQRDEHRHALEHIEDWSRLYSPLGPAPTRERIEEEIERLNEQISRLTNDPEG